MQTAQFSSSPSGIKQKTCSIKSRSRYYAEQGFTLVEIVVVLIILSVLFGILIPKVLAGADKAKADATRMKMNQLKGSVAEFRLRYNNLPSSIDELTGCSEKTGQGCVPICGKEDIEDAWGTPFSYAIENGGRSFKIKSLGADKQAGGSGVNFDMEMTGP